MNDLRNTVILLNAPPNSGKDTIAKAVCDKTGATHSEFKNSLYKTTAKYFQMDLNRFKDLATNRNTKEHSHSSLLLTWCGKMQWDELFGVGSLKGCEYVGDDYLTISPRQAMIFTSECYIKPKYGEQYFGEDAAKNLTPEVGNVFSDSGFDEEAIPIYNKIGHANVFVVQFTREGADSFEGDSRKFLDVPDNVNLLKTTNNGTIEEVVDEILSWVHSVRCVQQETFGKLEGY